MNDAPVNSVAPVAQHKLPKKPKAPVAPKPYKEPKRPNIKPPHKVTAGEFALDMMKKQASKLPLGIGNLINSTVNLKDAIKGYYKRKNMAASGIEKANERIRNYNKTLAKRKSDYESKVANYNAKLEDYNKKAKEHDEAMRLMNLEK